MSVKQISTGNFLAPPPPPSGDENNNKNHKTLSTGKVGISENDIASINNSVSNQSVPSQNGPNIANTAQQQAPTPAPTPPIVANPVANALKASITSNITPKKTNTSSASANNSPQSTPPSQQNNKQNNTYINFLSATNTATFANRKTSYSPYQKNRTTKVEIKQAHSAYKTAKQQYKNNKITKDELKTFRSDYKMARYLKTNRTKAETFAMISRTPIQTPGYATVYKIKDIANESLGGYDGNGEKEAIGLAVALVVSHGAKNDVSNPKKLGKLINDGTALTGFYERRTGNKIFYDSSGKKLIAKTSNSVEDVLKGFGISGRVDYRNGLSVANYRRKLNKVAKQLGLGSALGSSSNAYLEAKISNLKSNITSFEKAIKTGKVNNKKLTAKEIEHYKAQLIEAKTHLLIVEDIFEHKNLKQAKQTAITESMSRNGIQTNLTSINYRSRNDISVALSDYSRHFQKTGTLDYTKMSTKKLKGILKNDKSLSPPMKENITMIIKLQEQQQRLGARKAASRNTRLKAFQLASKVLGGSDAMQGFHVVMQMGTAVKTALVAANVTRKLTGRLGRVLAKGAYKGTSYLLKKTNKGTKIVNKTDNLIGNISKKYNKIHNKPKELAENSRRIVAGAKQGVVKGLKNSKLGKGINKIKSSKAFNNPAANLLRKAGNLGKSATKSISTAFSKVFNFFKTIIHYVAMAVGIIILIYVAASGIVHLINTMMGTSEANEFVGTDDGAGNYTYTPAELTSEDSILIDVVKLLITTDNNWQTELKDIASSSPSKVVTSDAASADFPRRDEEAATFYVNFLTAAGYKTPTDLVTGYYNPNKKEYYEISNYGNNDKDESGKKLNSGVYYSYIDNSGNGINPFANIKMCISLAHGFIQADYELYMKEFKDFAIGLWENSHDYKYNLQIQDAETFNPYIYSCNSTCNETYAYECNTEETATLNANYASHMAILSSDINHSKDKGDRDYASVITDKLIQTDIGCISITHKNDGTSGYVEYDNVLKKKTKDKEGLVSLNYITNTTKLEKNVYRTKLLNPDIYLGDSEIAYIQSINCSYDCDNYKLVEIGRTKTYYCNTSISDISISEGTGFFNTYVGYIKGCVYYDNGYCGTKQIAPNGNEAYITSTKCDYGKTITYQHGVLGLSSTPCEGCTKLADSLFYCNIHTWHECQGHNGYSCPGHTFPLCKAVCQGHGDCLGHKAKLCKGHVDLDVTAIITGMDENNNLYTKNMWDKGEIDNGVFDFNSPNFRSFYILCDIVYGGTDASGKPTNPLNMEITENGNTFYTWTVTGENEGVLHWNTDMIDTAEALYNSDWSAILNKVALVDDKYILDTKLLLSTGEADDLIKKFYPLNMTRYEEDEVYKEAYNKRKQLLEKALHAVSRIPYHPNGEATAIDFASNNFGTILKDADGKLQKVTVTADGKDYEIYVKGLNNQTFVLWATSTTSLNKTLPTFSALTNINAITPGDAIRIGSEYGVYLGYDAKTNKLFYITMMAPGSDAGNVVVSSVDYISGYAYHPSFAAG